MAKAYVSNLMEAGASMPESMPKLVFGYKHCACRDCFELVIGKPGEFCDACKNAGCETSGECKA